jgi:predicted metalloprotease with PDZ domain
MILALPLVFAIVHAAPAPLALDVDCKDIARHIVHTQVTVPLGDRTGATPVVLQYPKWIPGEHGPTGPINGVVNLRFTVAGKAVAWTRDPLDAYVLRVDAPAGAKELVATFDFVSAKGGVFSSSPNSTENVAVLSFNHVLLYPHGAIADDLRVHAKLKLPRGWNYGSGLATVKRTGEIVDFETASLTTVVDSPVNMGRFHKRIDLGGKHTISIVAESAAALDIPADTVTQWKQLVTEADAMFGGAHHYRHYEFLLTLSDEVEEFGLEHHESSDNRLGERTYIDDDKRAYSAYLLPHEFAHSWNGKYRRPAGLAVSDYGKPMTDELLWVYEGLTEYLGWVLAARSGLQIESEWAAERGMFFAAILGSGGRAWRPLQDTATMAAELYASAGAWRDARRGVDFYDEAALLWLGADVKIRALSGGTKSLDDFLRAFHGGPSTGKAELRTYTFDDVIAALNDTAAYDWRAYWRSALDATKSTAAADALASAGWRIDFVADAPDVFETYESVGDERNYRASLGFAVENEGGAIEDVVVDSPAWKAGVVPGMTLVAVNGRKDAAEVMLDALKTKKPIEVLVQNGEFFRTVKLEYKGGPRYPLLARDPKASADVLSQILAPKTPHVARTRAPGG